MQLTTISVKFSRRIDLGYAPYIIYLKKLGPKAPPFGVRDNSNMEMELYLSAALEPDEDVDKAGEALLLQARTIMDNNLNFVVPGAIVQAAKTAGIPEDAFIVEKTEVVRTVGDF